jgi:hypothetical protein
MLRGESDLGMTISPTDDIAPTKSKPSCVDAKADNNEETDYPHLSAATFTHSRSFSALHDWPYRVKHHSGPGLHGWMQRAPVSTPDIVPEGGKFIEAVYTNAAGSRAYKVYIPSRYQGQTLPLIVMLHGGTRRFRPSGTGSWRRQENSGGTDPLGRVTRMTCCLPTTRELSRSIR